MLRIVVSLVLIAATVHAQVPPGKALATMQAGDGLQVQLFAAEPMLLNPTNMDIDPFGRVWITEAVNYRCDLKKKPLNRMEGDRIVILIDKDGDGKADESNVFYQGKELQAPLGICIVPFLASRERQRPENAATPPVADAPGSPIGYRVLVSQSPNILEFTDADGDLKADGPPKIFLTGFGGVDHDHGVHSIQVGPDGKFYFTVGDEGFKNLKSSDGKQTFTQNRTTMQAGTVWRCDPDGKNLELIAHNFRNPYEACIDSFGEIWLSDNDDDGNQQTRICFVLPGGNYGYWPRGKGESHWHEEQPGIVPKVLRTGFGSPCGICVYEGTLLPEKFRGALIHADAGPREIRAFHRKPKGAGYELDKTLMLTSTDTWFRPSDVCVAPDGSLFVCDWYDPGVGGHGMGDTTRGRVYRITDSKNHAYKCADVKTDDATGILMLLMNPNESSKILGQSLIVNLKREDMRTVDRSLLKELATNPKSIARMTAMECRIRGLKNGIQIQQRPFDADPLSKSGFIVRLLEMYYLNLPEEYTSSRSKEFVKSKEEIQDTIRKAEIAVVREILLLTRRIDLAAATNMVLACVDRYDGQDRFYLAALNIACGTDPKRRDEILKDFDKHFPEWNDKVADLVFELRPKCMMPKLDGLLNDAKLTAAQKARIVDILATSDDASAGKTMLALLAAEHPPEVKAKAIEQLKFYLPTKWKSLAGGAEMKAAIDGLLANPKSHATALHLIAATGAVDRVDDVRKLLAGDAGFEAIRTLGQLRSVKSAEILTNIAKAGGVAAKSPNRVAAIHALAALIVHPAKDDISLKAMESLKREVLNDSYREIQKVAIEALAGTRTGTAWLIDLHKDGKFPKEHVAFAGTLLRNSPFQGERNLALQLFAASAKLDPAKLSPAELAKRTGDAGKGRKVFLASYKGEAQCMKCHTVKEEGGAIGPDLSTIGKKASRENLYESILQPSKAIADQFATWKIDADDGTSVSGLIVKETPESITLRDANGKNHDFPAKGVEKKKLVNSLMADDTAKALTEQELIDLVEYLFSLKE